MANRAIARDLGVSPKTIDDRLSHMGRHCMLFHQEMIRTAPPPKAIVVDGFESFELSQYYPFHHHLAVEKETDFFIYFTDSELRRKGSMRDVQKRRRRILESRFGRPDPKAVRKDMQELLRVSLKGQRRADVFSDSHRAYPPAIRSVPCTIRHHITPGKDYRDRHNKLWEINLLDLLIRHCGANHRRETIAWSKRRQASAERLAVFLVWRNYMKGRREKERGSPTPAMARGMTKRAVGLGDLFRRRIFRTRVPLPPRWARYYERTVKTRALGPHRTHQRVYAY